MSDIIDMEEWAPRTGFLGAYLEWTKNHEGPLRFQYFTALTILAGMVGRRFYINKGYYKIYPNLYTLLVAPTGICRKSTTTKIGLSLMQRTDVRVLSNKITPEELIFRLETVRGTKKEKPSEGFLYASELTVLLGKQSYNEGLIDILTDWADAPDSWSYATRGGGKIELTNICLVLLACSTPEWLGEAIPSRAYTGGFLARILFVAQDQTSRNFPLPMLQDEAMRDQLRQFLIQVRQTSGEFTFSQDGLAFYKRWYEENRDANDFEDLRLNGYYERRPDHILRVAMLMAIAEQLPLELTADLLRRAFAVLQAIEPSMPQALKQINLSAAGRENMRLLNIITSAKEHVPYADLMRAAMMFMSSRMVDETIRSLVASGKVVEFITPRGRVYGLRREGAPSDNGLPSGIPEGDKIQ